MCVSNKRSPLGRQLLSTPAKRQTEKFNVYAETREQCETKLAEKIAQKKAEIAEEKAKLKEGAD